MTTAAPTFYRLAFPVSTETYRAAVTEALRLVKRSDPTHMIATAVNTMAECFAEEVQPEDAARCILDDAMTGQAW